MSYEIVVFHAQNPGKHFSVKGDLDGVGMLNLLIRSARRFDSSIGLTILTTRDTDLCGIEGPYRRVDYEINFDDLMLERARAQSSFLVEHLGPRPMALLDSDVLVNRDLASLFKADFDIGLTWRERKGMPFNGGVLLVNNRRPSASIKYFTEFLQIFEGEYRQQALWYGDQLAMTKAVNVTLEQIRARPEIEKDGIRYIFLPCVDYNFSPEWKARFLLYTPVKNKILHFKGSSRRMMEPFWRYRLTGGQTLLSKGALVLETLRLLMNTRSYRKRWKKDARRGVKKGQGRWRHLNGLLRFFGREARQS